MKYLIFPKELQQLLAARERVQLIDVRTPEKHSTFNIGGQLIPIEELPDRLNELDKNHLIVTYCTTGGRSMRALELLRSLGFENVKSLEGGVTCWQEMLK